MAQQQFDFNRAAQLRILERAVIPDPPPEKRTARIRNRGTLKSILKALDSYQRERGSCHPSISTLAHNTGLSVRTIQRGLKLLESIGLIARTSQRRHNGSATSNDYAINWLRLVDLAPADAAVPQLGGGDNLTGGGDKLSPGGCHPDAPMKRPLNRPEKRKTHRAGDVFFEEGGTEGNRFKGSERKKYWGFDRPLTRSDLTHGPTVSNLFRFAVARGWGDLQETEADRLKFFAIARFCVHKATDPNDCGRYLTHCLKHKLYGNIRAEDDEAARRYLAEERNAELGVRNSELNQVAASLFVAATDEETDAEKPDRRAELARRAQLERSQRSCP